MSSRWPFHYDSFNEFLCFFLRRNKKERVSREIYHSKRTQKNSCVTACWIHRGNPFDFGLTSIRDKGCSESFDHGISFDKCLFPATSKPLLVLRHDLSLIPMLSQQYQIPQWPGTCHESPTRNPSGKGSVGSSTTCLKLVIHALPSTVGRIAG